LWGCRRRGVIGGIVRNGLGLWDGEDYLHFHVMDAPIPLAANGLPYPIDAFTITGTPSGTAAFDKAEADGTPLAIARVTPPRTVSNALPLDQLEITLRGPSDLCSEQADCPQDRGDR
jgi:hypothetical protein